MDLTRAAWSLGLLFTHNYVRQGFYSPVAIRKLAVTKFYPDFMKLRNSSGASAFVKLQIY